MEFFKPKLNFLSTPTQFHEMKRLREEIKCKPRIFVKRDDLTEVGLGGNKTRKLEYVMYEAVEQGADCIVTWAGVQSNHIRQTVAYAVKLGMECHIIINGNGNENLQGNFFLFDVYGAIKHFEPDESLCPQRCEELAAQLAKQGKKPYVVPIGASNPLGTIGYIESAKEVAQQAMEHNVKVGALFAATGSSGTQAGLELGTRLFMPHCKVHGVSVSRASAPQCEKVAQTVNDTSKYLGLDIQVNANEIIVHDEYYGGKYAVPTQAGIDTIKLVGRTEAIVLDPVYSAKAMSGMLDLLKKGRLDEHEAVVFMHTGGSPAIFNFIEYFK